MDTLSSALSWLLANGPALVQGLLALVGALASLFHIFHADGANGFFDKVTSALQFVASKFSK